MYEILFLVLLGALYLSGRRIADRVWKLESEIAALKQQIAASATLPALAETAGTEATATEAPMPDEVPKDYALPPEEEAAIATDDDEPQPAVPLPAAARESLESRLGARWAVWAGGLALALGGIFLVRYTIESGLLGPGARLSLAGLFGLVLIGAGEAIRRKVMPHHTLLHSNAMIPGVLTAAGSLSLFSAIYAAHAFYGFIGTAAAFALLALVAFATLGLSLLHGQALAGLGMLGSMLTPALVSSESGNIPVLFGFLTLSLVATALASRLRGWTIVPGLASLALGLWALACILFESNGDILPPVLALLAMIATAIFIWPAGAFDSVEEIGTVDRTSLLRLLRRRPRFFGIAVSLAAILPALALPGSGITPENAMAVVAITGALSSLGAARHFAVWPAILAAFAVLAGVSALSETSAAAIAIIFDPSTSIPVHMAMGYGAYIAASLLAAAIFTLTGLSFIWRKGEHDPAFATLYAAIAAFVPAWAATISFLQYGNFVRDWTHGLFALALGGVLLAAAEWLGKKAENKLVIAQSLLVTGAFAALVLALHALTSGLVTTVGLSVIGLGFVQASRYRTWPALPWMMALASAGVLARIAWEPTIVGAQHLGTTPVFNALLPGYGIPAVLAILAAWQLRTWPGQRVRYFLQAIASLMGLLTLAILVRHAMNGGTLESAVPTLGEQSIYTLLTVGMSGVLMTLDLRSPSPVFRYGSMLAGVIAMFNIAIAHFVVLNPWISGENTGPWPFFNLLLIGYLLPGLAYAGLAYYARGRRPLPYVILLALCGASLGFAWATLSVRRFWQGENIAAWKGFMQGETYTYSVVWLGLGVILLALGSRFNARSLRLASAVLVLISVAKVFLVDMSNLEGVLRALSFIGLGVVLIGIGLFYQKILARETPAAATGQST